MFRVAQARCASRPRRIRTEGVKAALPCLFLFLLAGCTSKNDAAYPSLSPRPVEKIAAEDLSPDDTPAPEPQAVDPAILKRMAAVRRSEEHTSELQSLMPTSYAVFCFQKKTGQQTTTTNIHYMR